MSILGWLAAGIIGATLLNDNEDAEQEEYDKVEVPDEEDYDKQWIDWNYYQIDDDWKDK